MATSKQFLLVQLFSNGDCLYATTVARQLKTDFPGCHLTWAVAPFCKNILYNNPYIDDLWVIEYITDRRIETFRKNRRRLFAEAAAKKFDEIFFTQIIEENFSFYNGLVRSSIFTAFGRPITVPVDPVIVVDEKEKKRVDEFVRQNKLSGNDFTVLFECAPQSGQMAMDIPTALQLSKKIIKQHPDIRIILSSATPISSENESIIDGSVLTLRETACLTHYCQLLIGCSSGITWASTSTAASHIPSIQILNKHAYIFNSPTLDHLRMGLPVERWLEITDYDEEKLAACVSTIKTKSFDLAKGQFGQKPIQTFKLYRGITHTFLSRGEFGLLRKFISRNYGLYGLNGAMFRNIFLGVALFPVQLLFNRIKRKT